MKIKLNSLDILTSEIVRRLVYYDGESHCEYCGKVFVDTHKDNGDIYPAWKHLQVSHFIGRRYKNTRYLTENCACLCFACHNLMHDFPAIHKSFFDKRIGSEVVERLEILARSGGKPDMEMITLNLKAKIKIMEESYDSKGLVL